MLESGFTIQEQEEFNIFANSFNLDVSTKQYAHDLIEEYKIKANMVIFWQFCG